MTRTVKFDDFELENAFRKASKGFKHLRTSGKTTVEIIRDTRKKTLITP